MAYHHKWKKSASEFNYLEITTDLLTAKKVVNEDHFANYSDSMIQSSSFEFLLRYDYYWNLLFPETGMICFSSWKLEI